MNTRYLWVMAVLGVLLFESAAYRIIFFLKIESVAFHLVAGYFAGILGGNLLGGIWVFLNRNKEQEDNETDSSL